MCKLVSCHAKNLWPLITAACFLVAAPVSAALPEQTDNSTALGGIKEHIMPPQELVKPRIEVPREEPVLSRQDDQTKIRVEKIRIIGQTLYSEAVLQALIKDAYGMELTLGELEGYARKITQYFRGQGYLVARAVIPAQTIEHGEVTIQVLVGQYDQIQVQNNSTLRQTVVDRVLSPLKSGDYIRKDTLERVLLLLTDTEGISSKATLVAGNTPGTSNLLISIEDTEKATGQAYIDNHGSRYTGKNRFGFNYTLHNLSGAGDTLLLGSILGKDMEDYSLSYQLPTGRQGAQVGIGYSRSSYTLGEDFADLNASGIANTISIYERFALTRSRNFNLTGRIGFDHKELEDRIDFVSINSRKSANRWSIGASGDSRDNVGGNAYNSFSLTFSLGRLSMDSADAVNNDDSAQTAGRYSKTNLSLYRVQTINNRVNLHLSFAGQMADKNLDSLEKMSLGGPNGVRAYPVNEASGDEGYVTTGELRWSLPDPGVQLAAFVDCGHVKLNEKPWTNDVNGRTLAGAGLGFIFNRPNDYVLRLDYAWKLTSSDAVSDADRSGRFWLQGVKYI